MKNESVLFTLFLASSFLIGAEAVARTAAQQRDTDLGRMTLRLRKVEDDKSSGAPKARI